MAAIWLYSASDIAFTFSGVAVCYRAPGWSKTLAPDSFAGLLGAALLFFQQLESLFQGVDHRHFVHGREHLEFLVKL